MTYQPYGVEDYDLAIRVSREQSVRRKQIHPRQDAPQELRWAAEGDRPIAELDTVKAWVRS